MDNAGAFVVTVYGLALACALIGWWNYGRKHKGFTKIKCRRRGISDTLTFHRVLQSDADALVSAHQSGNRGPQLLNMHGGGKASVDVGDFVAVEVG